MFAADSSTDHLAEASVHSAPAVSYPVGRSRFQGGLTVLISWVGAVVALLWVDASHFVGWRQWTFVLLLLLSCAFAYGTWWRVPQGMFRWDGAIWSWMTADVELRGRMTVHLDLQSWLLVSLQTEQGKRVWLWPERRSEASRWGALRQAVFSRCDAIVAPDPVARNAQTQVTA